MCVYNLFIRLRIYKAIYFVVMMKHAYSYRKSQSLILKVTMMIKIGQGGCHGDDSNEMRLIGVIRMLDVLLGF